MNLSVLTRIGLASLSLLPATVLAVTLGQTRVLSYLGQPLHLEVELVGEDAAAVERNQVALGSEKDFERLSMSYSNELSGLTLTPRQQGGAWVIDIRSRQPFDQPYIEFPLTLRNRGATLVKGVTALLDPPNYQAPQVPQRRAIASAPPAATTTTNTKVSQYRVRRGDTLSGIAQRYRPQSLSTYQMTLALYQSNPDAFDNGNIDRLRAGALLAIPNAGGMVAPSDQVARAEVAARGEPARRAPVAVHPAETQKPQTTPTAGAEAEDQLQVLNAEQTPDTATDEQLRQQVLLTHEEVAKSRIEQQQMREQVAEMRDELDHLRRLLSLKDEQIATLQSLANARQQQLKSIAEKQAEATPESVGQPSEADTAADLAASTATAPQTPAPEPAAKPALASVTPPPVPAAVAKADPPPKPEPDWPWWWLFLGLLVVVPLSIWLVRRSSQHNDLEMALSEHPSIVNAPPKPYSDAQPPPAPAPKASPAPAAHRPPPATKTAARNDDDLDTIDIANLEESLLDEPFSELANLDEFTSKKASSDTPTINLDSTEEELMSEADLEELANQLNDEDTEFNPYTAVGDGSSAEPWETAEPTPLELDMDEPADDDELVLDMARAYVELGDRDGAIDILKEALRKGPTSQHEAVEAMLAELKR